MAASTCHRAAMQLQELEELPKACFLVAAQVPWLGEHAFDHARGLAPVCMNARPHEVLARPRSRTVRRDDRGNQGRELVDDLHDPTSQSNCTVPLQSHE